MQAIQPNYKLGVDISNNNGHVDMSTWKSSGVQYIFAKASEGATFKDGLMLENINKAKAAGIPIGLYHFARPSRNTAKVEADNFLTQFRLAPTELLPVLDVEDTNYTGTGQALVNWVKEFIGYVKAATGKDMIIYTAKWYFDRFHGLTGLETFKLWTALYPKDMTVPNISPANYGGWTVYTIWQFTDQGKLLGVSGTVDMNYAVSLEALGYDPTVAGQEDAIKVVKHLQTLYALTDSKYTQEAIHTAANAIRDKFNLKGLV